MIVRNWDGPINEAQFRKHFLLQYLFLEIFADLASRSVVEYKVIYQKWLIGYFVHDKREIYIYVNLLEKSENCNLVLIIVETQYGFSEMNYARCTIGTHTHIS